MAVYERNAAGELELVQVTERPCNKRKRSAAPKPAPLASPAPSPNLSTPEPAAAIPAPVTAPVNNTPAEDNSNASSD